MGCVIFTLQQLLQSKGKGSVLTNVSMGPTFPFYGPNTGISGHNLQKMHM